MVQSAILIFDYPHGLLVPTRFPAQFQIVNRAGPNYVFHFSFPLFLLPQGVRRRD